MLTERLSRCYTGIIQDVLRNQGLKQQSLPYDIMPLTDATRVAGPVFTMTGDPCGDDCDDDVLLSWTGFLSAALPGYVVICQPNDSVVAHMGELSAETLSAKGVLGYVVDGGTRDVEFIRKLGFPVFCRYRTPADVVGYWKVTAMQVPIKIGQVSIDPGDYLIGDQDGVMIIPRAIAETVVTEAETLMNTENLVRKAIREGVDPQQAYLQYRKF